MSPLSSSVLMLSAGFLVLGAELVCGQNYPNKPIRIVTSESGSGSDFVARLMAPGISGALGQQVIVENRGGSVAIMAQIVGNASADGYTLLFFGNGLWIMPFMQKVPYDPVRDFLPVTLATSSPNVLVVYPPLPVKSVNDLIALAKTKPGALNYGSSGTGSANHLAAELFKSMAGVNLTRVSYRGSGPGAIAVMAGEVQLMFPNAVSATPHVKSGKLRTLAVTSAQPSALFPGLPTVAASGLPGYESAAVTSIFAPAKTPATIVNRLNREIVQVLRTPEAKERLFNFGAEVVGSSPKDLALSMRSEMANIGKLIKDAGIRGE